jgi:hypothetical protein
VQNGHSKPGLRLYVDDQGLVVGAALGPRRAPVVGRGPVPGTCDGVVVQGRSWPGTLVALESHPSDVGPSWAEHAQGVAHAQGCWFITQADRMWRFPVDLDLAHASHTHPAVSGTGIPEPDIEHLGDCDVHRGALYVAMEGGRVARIGLFDLDLRFQCSAPLAAQGSSCPWCAVDPRTGLVYSSPFDTDRVSVYRVVRGGARVGFQHLRDVPLLTDDGAPLTLERVQGGAFSRQGHLYLSSDCRDGGISGIDIDSGRRRLHVTIPFDPGWPDNEVIEGLTLVDLDKAGVPWLGGKLHVLVLSIRPEASDRIWLRHYDVSESDGQETWCSPG